MPDAPGLSFLETDIEDLVVPHEVEVVPHLGAAAVRVPLALPTGRSGFGPRLTLEYDSSAGNSPFGLGWSLGGLLAVSLDTRRSLPRYDGTDGYVLSGSGELVPALEAHAGQWRPRVEDRGAFWVRRYRARVETRHIRIERWVEKATGRDHWRTRDVRDVVTVYGLGQGRIADPADPLRTFTWLPEAQYDPQGNAIVFDYAPESLDGVDLSLASERRHVGAGGALPQRYLKRIRYGNTRPLGADTAVPGDDEWLFEVVFDYGDHTDPDAPAPAPDRPWPARPDPYSTCRPGFEVRTYRLCRRVLAFHRFGELGPDPVLVGAYRLELDEAPQGSTVGAVSYTGSRRDPATGQLARRSLPPLRLAYTDPSVARAFEPAPAGAEVNVPGGLGTDHRWLDLYGDGLPGILTETSQAWYYKANEGGGRFAPQQVVPSRPGYRLGRCAITDFDADGNANLVVLHGREAGFYEYDRDAGAWTGFRPLAAFPHVEAAGRRAQWVDLNGDGRADLVVADPQRLTWYPSEGKHGFGAPIEIRRPAEAPAASPLGEDLALDFFFADMNGDGLADQVRVRNGRVEYWPHLGHGRFGDPILMDGSPVFAPEHEFDAGRVRLVDLDGNGTADILYVGPGEARYWINAGGNRLIEGGRLTDLPYVDNVSTLRVLDFLGDGTSCLVWSTPLPDRPAAIHYLPLTGGVAPRLLLSVDNSMGREVRLAYGTSARHYLRDRHAGVPWRTRLPFHPVVVDAKEVIDHVGGSRTTTRYAYHDGRFDGTLRLFRGFGLVEQFDTEVHDGTATAPEIAHTAPACVRTWYHVGLPVLEPLPRRYAADPLRAAPPAQVIEHEDELLAGEADDAARALAGLTLRQEVFAAGPDGTLAPHPFQVVQHAYRVRRIQPGGAGAPPSFTYVLAERLVDDYEQEGGDPRTAHELTLDADEYGFPRLTCEVGYPRRAGRPVEASAQPRLLAAVTATRLAHVDLPDRYELGLPVEERRLEVAGIAPGAAGVFSRDGLQAALAAALAAPRPYDEALTGAAPEARVIGWGQTYYWNDARTAALPLGEVGRPALPHHEESACFTPAFVADAYGGRVDAHLLETDGAYRLRDGYWWLAGPTSHFGGADAFFRLARLERPDGGGTRVTYDPYALAAVELEDPLGNRVRARIDYHLAAPDRVTDPNGAVAEVIYDPLGVAVVSTAQGLVLDGAGDPRPHGHDLLAAYVPRAGATFDGVLADPGFFLQGAAQFLYYELDTWTAAGTPPRAVRLVREALRHDGGGGGAPAGPVQVTVTYFDGLRRILQAKTRVEAGPAVQRDGAGLPLLDAAGEPVEADSAERWLVTGHTVFNRKQQPVRQYEPFYSTLSAYESDAVLAHFGAFRQLQYDGIGRLVREESPNGTFGRIVYGPWRVEHHDPNDTVAESLYRVVREGLPDGDPEKAALRKAEAHAGTPAVSHLDPLGREVRRVEPSGDGNDRATETRLDREGRPTAVTDPRGLTTFRYASDMLGRPCATASADAGDTWSLLDIHDRPVHVWDGRGVHVRRTFDRLDRPTGVFVDGAPGPPRMAERMVYGEDPSVAQAEPRNLRGRLAVHFDQAGVVTVRQYDWSGMVLGVERRLLEDHTSEPDWTDTGAVALGPERYVTMNVLDALGRLRSQSLPDGTTRRHEYLAGGGLARSIVTSDDGRVAGLAVLDGAAYNARGQRTHARLGNGVEVAHHFDRETFRTTRITARRPAAAGGPGAATLQDLRYTYDPVGNVTRFVDESQQPGVAGPFLQGLNVSPESDYTYDPFYQLVRATGRVHQALLEHDYRPGAPGPDAVKGTRHLTFNNGAAVERYTRTYSYDLSGNLTRLVHTGASRSWTTDLWVSPASNRSLPARDPSGAPVAAPETRFDAAGNCLFLPHVRRMAWTYRSTLARVVLIDRSGTGQPDDAEYYQYDGQGLRVRKVTERLVAGAVEATEVLYLDGCTITRVRSGATPTLERLTSHVFDGLSRIALIDRWSRDDLARETDDIGTARVRYQLASHLGSARIELDHEGAVVGYEEYFPFGGTAFVAGDDLREVTRRAYRFCGKERDDATGLSCIEHRYYAPWIGRWLSPDPIGPEDDHNLYRYVRNNPINLVDPDGLQSTLPAGGVTYVPVELEGPFRDAFLRLTPAEREQYIRGTIGLLVDDSGEIRPAPRAEIIAAARRRAREGEYVNIGLTGGPPRRPRPAPAARVSEGGARMEFDPLVVTVGPTEAMAGMEDEPGASPAALGEPVPGGTGSGSDAPRGAEHGADGREGGAVGADGGAAGAGGTSSSGDEGASGVHAADGSSSPTTPPGGGTGGGGTGGGSGTGTGRSGTGPGAGGTAHGDVPGTGSGGRRGSGSGTGRGTRTGPGANGRDGARGTGGSGSAAHDADDGTGTGTGAPGGTGTGTEPGGAPGGIREGTPGGTGTTPGGAAGTLPPSPGGGLPPLPGPTRNGDDPHGSRTGTLTGTRDATDAGRGGEASGSTAGSGRGRGTPGSPPPSPGGGGGGAEGGAGGAPQERTLGDTIVHYLGYLNLEFGDGDPNGQSGGIPGGSGTHNWGGWGQALYGLLTVASVILMFFGGAGIKGAMLGLRAGLRAAIGFVARVFTREFWRQISRRIGEWFFRRGVRMLLREARGYMAMGFSRAHAAYLIRPYSGMFHHFLPRRWGSWLPRAIIEHPLNLMGRGLSRGRFYIRHFLGDPYFYGARFPRALGGSWSGTRLGLTKPAFPFNLWYAAPNWLRATGVVGAAGGVSGGAYVILSDDDDDGGGGGR